MVEQPLLDELAALVAPALFQGTPDAGLNPVTLEKRNAARDVVQTIARRVTDAP